MNNKEKNQKLAEEIKKQSEQALALLLEFKLVNEKGRWLYSIPMSYKRK